MFVKITISAEDKVFEGQKNAWENAKNQETTLIRKRGMEKDEKSLTE